MRISLWGFQTLIWVPDYGPPVARNGIGCKMRTRYPALPLKRQSSDRLFWEFRRYVVIQENVTSPSLLCPRREFGPSMRQWATNVVHFSVIWITVLLLWRITCRVLWRLWNFHNETSSGVYLSHGWEGIRGKRNFGFDSLKYMNRGRRKGLLPAIVSRRRGSLATIPFSSMSRFSLLQIDVEVEVTETSENPNAVVWDLEYRLEAHTAFCRDNIYYMI